MRRIVLGILLLFIGLTNCTAAGLAQSAATTTVNVKIFTTTVVNTFIFSPLNGLYNVYGDGILLAECDPSGIYQMNVEGDSIRLKTFENNLGKFKKIKMLAKETASAFKIKSVVPKSKVRMYDDNLEIQLSSDKKQFLLINCVDLEDYIAGVVQSEAGKDVGLEYYKLQAILCRTYLLAHLNRHIAEGYELCDDVHCQAYLSRTSEDIIVKAVVDTRGLVVVDSDLNLITAAFHSNCGGETCNSQDVWAMPTTYLKSVKDTFCIHKSQAHWQRSITADDWKTYLRLKRKYNISDTMKFNTLTSFSQDNGRAIYFTEKSLRIPLKTIRADFKLKSTFFSIKQVGDSVIFDGRGYGHGVGLCQEGAMNMSLLKHSYKEILHFYYKDVNLVDLSALNYFRQE
jgi:stage II sporulation protein D